MADILDQIEEVDEAKPATVFVRLSLKEKSDFVRALEFAQKKTKKKKVTQQSLLETFIREFTRKHNPKAG